MTDSAQHAPPHTGGTARRFLDANAVEITADVVRFRDGSAIERADGLLAPEPPIGKARGVYR
jgi:hypothetical protein